MAPLMRISRYVESHESLAVPIAIKFILFIVLLLRPEKETRDGGFTSKFKRQI